MKLISTTEFVLRDVGNQDHITSFIQCCNYARFIKQPSDLWMFIACDDDNKPMKHPDELKGTYSNSKAASKYRTRYNKAMDKILFEGFKLGKYQSMGIYWFIKPNNYLAFNPKTKRLIHDYGQSCETIEDFTNLDLTLTKTAQKQIGL